MNGDDEEKRTGGRSDIEGPLDAVTVHGVTSLTEGHQRHAREVLEACAPSNQLEVARHDVDGHRVRQGTQARQELVNARVGEGDDHALDFERPAQFWQLPGRSDDARVARAVVDQTHDLHPRDPVQAAHDVLGHRAAADHNHSGTRSPLITLPQRDGHSAGGHCHCTGRQREHDAQRRHPVAQPGADQCLDDRGWQRPLRRSPSKSAGPSEPYCDVTGCRRQTDTEATVKASHRTPMVIMRCEDAPATLRWVITVTTTEMRSNETIMSNQISHVRRFGLSGRSVC